MNRSIICIGLIALLLIPVPALPQGEVVEIYCSGSGFRQRYLQGASAADYGRNVQSIIVVCERNRQIRSIRIPIDPNVPVHNEPLLARQYGTGLSKLLGIELPKFLVPGNTCPLFPLTAYLEANICPIDGSPGIQYAIVDYF